MQPTLHRVEKLIVLARRSHKELPDDVDPKVVANKAHEFMSQQSYDRASKLLDELKAYVTGGNFSEPFKPTGLDSEGNLSEPLRIVEEMRAGEGYQMGLLDDEGAQSAPTILLGVIYLVGIVVLSAVALVLHKVRRKLSK